MSRYEFLTKEQAKQAKYYALTTAYDFTDPGQKRHASQVLADQRAAGVAVALVGEPRKAEIWRKRTAKPDASARRLREIWNRL